MKAHAACLLIPVILYLIAVLFGSVNIPLVDDYDIFFNDPNQSGSILKWVLKSHNEHWMAGVKLTGLLVQWTTDRINIYLLNLIGNCYLLGTLLLLLNESRRIDLSLLEAVPVVCLTLSFLNWDNMTWAAGSQQHFGSMFFAITAFHLNKRHPILSVICAAGSLCFGAAGFMALTVSCLGIYWNSSRMHIHPSKLPCKLHASRTAIYRTIILAAIVILAAGNSALVFGVHWQWTDWILYYFIMIGGVFKMPVPAFNAGVIACVLSSFVLMHAPNPERWDASDQKHRLSFLDLALIHLFGTVFLTAIGRYQLGFVQAVSSRYMYIPLLIYTIIYIHLAKTTFLSESVRKIAADVVAIIIIIAFFTSILIGYPRILSRKHELVDGLRNWIKTGQGLDHPSQVHASKILNAAIKNGDYQLPDYSPQN